jgi:hypothetical protein
MKRKLIWALLLVLVLGAGIGVYWFQTQKPTIRFVRFGETAHGYRTAVFRIENSTPYTFAFSCFPYDKRPDYRFRWRERSRWKYGGGVNVLTVPTYSQINAKESLEFEASLRTQNNTPYYVGIYFHRGTVEEISQFFKTRETEYKSEEGSNFFEKIGEFTRRYLPGGPTDMMTWSDPVQP